MRGPREPKKSETVEVRLSHEVKRALMDKARSEGRSASEVIRDSIGSYLADRPEEKSSMLMTAWKPITIAATAAAVTLWTALAPAPVAAGPDLRAAFDSFDADKDGTVTLDEFRKGHAEDRLFVRSAKPASRSAPFMIPLHHPAPPPKDGTTAIPEELLRAEFSKEDKDGNGSVDFNEFEAFHRAMMGAAFANIDRNADGGVDSAELLAVAEQLPPGAPRPRFSDLDRNKDGKLDSGEFFRHR